MKSIFIIPVFIILFVACNDSKSETKVEEKIAATESNNAVIIDSTPTKSEQNADTNKISVVDLVGIWEQTKQEKIGNEMVTGIININLMMNGDFIASAVTISKRGQQNSPQQTGKWTLYEKTVSLSGMRKLVYNEKTKMLVDAAAGVELRKQ